MVAAAIVVAVLLLLLQLMSVLQLKSVLIMEATTIGGRRAGTRLLMLPRLIANRKLAAALVLEVSNVIHVIIAKFRRVGLLLAINQELIHSPRPPSFFARIYSSRWRSPPAQHASSALTAGLTIRRHR